MSTTDEYWDLFQRGHIGNNDESDTAVLYDANGNEVLSR